MIHDSSISPVGSTPDMHVDDLGPEDLVPIEQTLSPAERFWVSLDRAVAPSDAAMSDDYEDAPTEEVPIVVARGRSSGWSRH